MEFYSLNCCPNDVQSGGVDAPKINIITGLNASGKSVYLRQVGLLAVLAQVGACVPAKRMALKPADQLLTRISNTESLSEGVSAFAGDLLQMSKALNSATKNSLVIIDEFGKGTTSEVATGLLAAALQHWCALGEDCPHVFLCTHQLDALQFIPAEAKVRYLAMDTLNQADVQVFLYKLKHGTLDYDQGSDVIRHCGLPQGVKARAQQIFNAKKQQKQPDPIPELVIDRCPPELTTKVVDYFTTFDLDNGDLDELMRNMRVMLRQR